MLLQFQRSAVGQLRREPQILHRHAMKVEALAKMAHLSASAFHQHFKAVTSMSPLQFQKVLRLQEARRLMLSMMMDVSGASLRVGYLSVSQFSREYSRFFGSSPTRDIARLPEHLGVRGQHLLHK